MGERYWEPRHPQELVKGVPDYQSVPDPRPLPPNVFDGPIFVQLTANAAVGATSLSVETLTGLNVNDRIGVMMDSGEQFTTTISSIGANVIGIGAPLPGPASSGNLITDFNG